MFIQFGTSLIGMIYLAFGIIGLLPFDFLNPMHHEGIGVRYLFNLVAINSLHSFIHLAVGITGLIAARTFATSRRWGRICGPILLALFTAGIIQAIIEGFPKDQLFLGIIPLNSPGHVLHLVSGSIALYLGTVSGKPS
jgi:hypothetical protein